MSLPELKPSYRAIRVRRSIDNAEARIGFTISGALDKSAFLAFVGNGIGFNATQTTPTNQPQIFINGEVSNG
jgi:hypothetical protein